MSKVVPCLWFNGEAEAAANFYASIFKNSKVTHVSRYGAAAAKATGWPEGTALTVAFELDGQPFTALNGGPQYRFSEAVSFQVNCETQEELDHHWDALAAGGDEQAQRCGWLKDKFGVSWQIVPAALGRLMTSPDPAKSQRVMKAFMQMKKLDIRALERAHEG